LESPHGSQGSHSKIVEEERVGMQWVSSLVPKQDERSAQMSRQRDELANLCANSS
jgi:hypothetical protein